MHSCLHMMNKQYSCLRMGSRGIVKLLASEMAHILHCNRMYYIVFDPVTHVFGIDQLLPQVDGACATDFAACCCYLLASLS